MPEQADERSPKVSTRLTMGVRLRRIHWTTWALGSLSILVGVLFLWLFIILIGAVSQFGYSPLFPDANLAFTGINLCGLLGASIYLIRSDLRRSMPRTHVSERFLLIPSFITYGGFAYAAQFFELIGHPAFWPIYVGVGMWIAGLLIWFAAFIIPDWIAALRRKRAHAAGTLVEPAAAPPRISRRTVVVAVGALSLAAAAEGWLVRALPTLVARYTYLGQKEGVVALAWSPNGQRIASASWDATVQVWDALNGEHVVRHMTSNQFMYGVAWSPDGQRIASAAFSDAGENDVEVWDATMGQTLLTYPVDYTGVFAWEPHGERIASNDPNGGGLRIWETTTGQTLLTLPKASANATALAWSPDGRWLAVVNGDVTVWSVAEQRPLLTYRGHQGKATTIAWSPNGAWLASGGRDNTAQVWRPLTGAHLATFRSAFASDFGANGNNVRSVAWSPDSAQLAIAIPSETVWVWRVRPGVSSQADFAWRGQTNDVACAQWSPDGSLIASGSYDTVAVWRPQWGGWL